MRSMLFVSLVLSLIVATLLGTGAAAQEATPGAVPGASPAAATPAAAVLGEVLFVQTFTVGHMEPAAEPGAATLTLQGPEGETVYFGDPASPSAGTVPLDQFLEVLALAPAEPRQAALVIDQPEGDSVVVVELLGGTVDAAGTVIYDVRVLDDPGSLETDMTQTAQPLTEVAAAFDFATSHLFVKS